MCVECQLPLQLRSATGAAITFAGKHMVRTKLRSGHQLRRRHVHGASNARQFRATTCTVLTGSQQA